MQILDPEFEIRLVVVPRHTIHAGGGPALRPVRALLIRVPLGPRPWLHRLRHRSPGFVRRLRRYYAGVRLLWIVHQRLRLLTFPLRTIRPNRAYGRSRDLPVPAPGASVHSRVSDHAA